MEFTAVAADARPALTTGRKPLDNPFLPKVVELAAQLDETTSESATVMVVSVGSADPEKNEELAEWLRCLKRAGAAAGVTVRKGIKENGKKAELYFWVRPRITRKGASESE